MDFIFTACSPFPTPTLAGRADPAERLRREQDRVCPQGGGRAPPACGPRGTALPRGSNHTQAAGRAQLQPEESHSQGSGSRSLQKTNQYRKSLF